MNKLVLVISLLLFYIVYSVTPLLDKSLILSFLDVGQGDAIFVETTTNKKILIDGGPDGKILSLLGRAKRFRLNLLVLTHPHADHINGILALLRRIDVETLAYGNFDISTYPGIAEFCKTPGKCVELSGKKELILSNLEKLILFTPKCPSFENLNNCSVITKLIYKKFGFLFTGDAEFEEEAWLVDMYQSELNDVYVLKAGHHCSKTASSEALLNTTSPIVAICSCGRDNKFSHPHKEALDRLYNHDVNILRTDQLGAIRIKCKNDCKLVS